MNIRENVTSHTIFKMIMIVEQFEEKKIHFP